MEINVPESRREKTTRFLKENLGDMVLMWRRLTAQGLYKQAKHTASEIHKIIKKNDLVTTMVFSYPMSDSIMSERSKDR